MRHRPHLRSGYGRTSPLGGGVLFFFRAVSFSGGIFVIIKVDTTDGQRFIREKAVTI
jgi:hypothetical protein